MSVFSGFNQPADISMVPRYDTLCGITEDELHGYFSRQLEELAEEEGCTVDEMEEMFKQKYDGYHFSKWLFDHKGS